MTKFTAFGGQGNVVTHFGI